MPIRIEVSESSIKVEGIGYTDSSCAKDIDKVLSVLGFKVTDVENKPEYYVQESSSEQHYETGS